MSPKNSFFPVGLTVLGLLGSAARAVETAPGDAPALPSASAPALSQTVLLLSNGNILKGQISIGPEGYVIRQRGGEICFPKRQVEKLFDSIDEVYRYRLARVPERDPDEHMKLARWCLTEGLNTEAKTQLRAVLALSPRHNEARAMLISLEQAEVRASQAMRDPNVVQTRAEVVEGSGLDEKPEGVSARAFREARRALGVSGAPVIFDLPPAQAVIRANQFAQAVHPVLQRHCIRCHDDQYTGNFQLVPIKPRQNNAEALRSNLDATLRLIDPDNPARSDLLSSVLVPHGSGPNKRPILRGANDPEYQILQAWVNKLGPARTTRGTTAPSFAAQSDRDGDAFAANRANRRELPTFSPTPPSDSRPAPPSFPNMQTPVRLDGAKGMKPVAPDNADFPVPYLLGGPKPKLEGAAKPAPADSLPPLPGAAAKSAPAAKAATTATADDDDDEPVSPIPLPRKKPVKPAKIDPALLEKALLNRNAR